MDVRKVQPADAEQISEIYNFYIENSHSTFETERVNSVEMGRRLAEISEKFPFLACEDQAAILGYAYATKYKTRSAYRYSIEISVYVKNNIRQRGIGTRLYQNLFKELSKKEIHAVIAGIALPNEASIKLHEKFGMKKIAHFSEVGFKLDRWIDVGYWELIL